MPRRRPTGKAPDMVLAGLELFPAPRAVLELRAVAALFPGASDVWRGAVMHLQAPVIEVEKGGVGSKIARLSDDDRERRNDATTARKHSKDFKKKQKNSAHSPLTRAPRTSVGTQGEGTRTGPWAGRCLLRHCCLRQRYRQSREQTKERFRPPLLSSPPPLRLLLLLRFLRLHCH